MAMIMLNIRRHKHHLVIATTTMLPSTMTKIFTTYHKTRWLSIWSNVTEVLFYILGERIWEKQSTCKNKHDYFFTYFIPISFALVYGNTFEQTLGGDSGGEAFERIIF